MWVRRIVQLQLVFMSNIKYSIRVIADYVENPSSVSCPWRLRGVLPAWRRIARMIPRGFARRSTRALMVRVQDAAHVTKEPSISRGPSARAGRSNLWREYEVGGQCHGRLAGSSWWRCLAQETADVEERHPTRCENGRKYGVFRLRGLRRILVEVGIIGFSGRAGLVGLAARRTAGLCRRKRRRSRPRNAGLVAAQLRSQPHSQVAHQVNVATPAQSRSSMLSSSGGVGTIQAAVASEATDLELGLLHSTIPDKGSEYQSVRDAGGGQDFERCNQRAELLVGVTVHDGVHAVDGNGDEHKGESEQETQRNFALQSHLGGEDDLYGESDEGEIGYGICNAHGHELHEPLPTMRAWVGVDLPVVAKGLTFGESSNDHSTEGHEQEPSDEVDRYPPALFPRLREVATEELGYGEFGNPEAFHTLESIPINIPAINSQSGIEDPGGQHTLAADFPMPDILGR